MLQLAPLPPALETQLQREFDVHPLWREAAPQDFLAAHGSDFGLLLTHATAGADAALMDRLPQLRAICSLGVGCDALDLAAARSRGIVVSNTPDVLNDCVADLAVGLMIDVARGLTAADRHLRRGDWISKGPPPLGTRVSGKRLGFLGMGRIGQTVARRCAGFDMDIRYHTPAPMAESQWTHEASLLALADWADFLVVACSGGPATHHLVSTEVLQALGPQSFLINIARGSVVDEEALVHALQTRRLGGAALDVFEQEPQVPPALLAMDNVVLLPHIASGTAETRRAMADLVLRNVRRYVESGRLETEVRS
ncbi:2-hydroxyacid dehydrogenase [Variovorax saccharolyticus]|uniref:2-hydroxyacid dehydrogenase n=1 Tax=Variovorax saccharolyticus TaxID=3053516 RepID=UPI002577B257|nr:2-hydroxyacid dehydrogenase [Variovorax sp. J31P216]MDM0027008.1 2-hydroxyacid dehydrogenase [Variovorax sp. J31P216]